jgi:hypothetical protein
MSYFKRVWQAGTVAFFTLAGWWILLETALAQGRKEIPKLHGSDKSAEGGEYVLPYFIVLACVGIGLLLVCRPSKRSKESKPEGYDPKAFHKKDSE